MTKAMETLVLPFSDEEMMDILDTMAGKGNTGLVMPLPGGDRIIKYPVPWHSEYDKQFDRKQIRREIDVYRHLPQGHRRLIRMLDYNHDVSGSGRANGVNRKDGKGGQGGMGGERGNGTVEDVYITLEYMPNNALRNYLVGGSRYQQATAEQLARGAAISRRQRASWALEATDGVMLLHAHDVIYADIKPENMVLDNDLHIRLIDFSGCALRGQPSLSLESASFHMPRTPENSSGKMDCSVTTDLFALGSSFYQMMTCFAPWHGLSHDEIEARYSRGEFPPLVENDQPGQTTSQPMLFADTIWRCWHGEFATASDVLSTLKAEVRAAFGPEDLTFIEQQSGISLS